MLRVCFGGALLALLALILVLQLGAGPTGAAAAAGFQVNAVSSWQPPPKSFEERIGTWTREFLREVRRTGRRVNWLLNRSLSVWWKWFKRSSRFCLIALVAALADGQLVAAWRRGGMRVIIDYVPLMLYVYARLLLTPRVRLIGKVLLVLSIVYGVRRSDLILDRRSIGLVDDFVLIVVATRFFLYTCPEELVSAYAQSAVRWRQRVSTLQRGENAGARKKN
jgi:hypothetical protein